MKNKLFHQILQAVTMEGRQIKKSFKLLSGHVCLESLKFCVLHCRRADEDGKQDVPVPAASEEARPQIKTTVINSKCLAHSKKNQNTKSFSFVAIGAGPNSANNLLKLLQTDQCQCHWMKIR